MLAIGNFFLLLFLSMGYHPIIWLLVCLAGINSFGIFTSSKTDSNNDESNDLVPNSKYLKIIPISITTIGAIGIFACGVTGTQSDTDSHGDYHATAQSELPYNQKIYRFYHKQIKQPLPTFEKDWYQHLINKQLPILKQNQKNQ